MNIYISVSFARDSWRRLLIVKVCTRLQYIVKVVQVANRFLREGRKEKKRERENGQKRENMIRKENKYVNEHDDVFTNHMAS